MSYTVARSLVQIAWDTPHSFISSRHDFVVPLWEVLHGLASRELRNERVRSNQSVSLCAARDDRHSAISIRSGQYLTHKDIRSQRHWF